MSSTDLRREIFATGMSGTIGRHLGSSVRPINYNLLELPKELPQAKNGILIHLASRVGPTQVEKNPKVSKEINVNGTINLAKLAIGANFTRFVFISTSHVYAPNTQRIAEHNKVDPINIYAEQKYIAEVALRNLFERSSSTKLLIIRLFSVIGLEMKPFTLGGALARILAGEDVQLSSALDVRDFVHPRTAAKAIESISQNMEVEEDVINLCTGVGLSVKEACQLIALQEKKEIPDYIFKEEKSSFPYIVGNPLLLNKYLKVEKLGANKSTI
jgi:nucleoside-diphosphate-sugar epimerase